METLKKKNINKSKKNVKSRNKFSKSRKSVLKSRKNMVGGMFEIFKSKSKSKPSKINQSKRPLPTIPGEKPTEVIKPNMFHRLAGKVGYNTKKMKGYYGNLNRYTKDKNLYDLKQLEESRRQYQMREQQNIYETKAQKPLFNKTNVKVQNLTQKLREQRKQPSNQTNMEKKTQTNIQLQLGNLIQAQIKEGDKQIINKYEAKRKGNKEEYYSTKQIIPATMNEQKKLFKQQKLFDIKQNIINNSNRQKQRLNNSNREYYAEEASKFALQEMKENNKKYINTKLKNSEQYVKNSKTYKNDKNYKIDSNKAHSQYGILRNSYLTKKIFEAKEMEKNLVTKLKEKGRDRTEIIKPLLNRIIEIKGKMLPQNETEKVISNLFTVAEDGKVSSFLNPKLQSSLPKIFSLLSSERIKALLKTQTNDDLEL